MSNVVAVNQADFGAIESLLIQGDLNRFTPEQRVQYYQGVCKSLGLNPLTKPFDYINLQGKLVLYARKDATEQLRKIYKVSITIKAREQIGDVFAVTANARMPDGREDEAVGAVPTAGLKGDNLANALMKAETKAKRRVTLSICGLGILDETELETIPAKDKSDAATPGVSLSQANQDVQEMVQEGTHSTAYRIPFGQYRGRALEEVGPRDLADYVNYLERKAEKDGKPIQGKVAEFIEEASAYIAAFENGGGA